LIHGYKECILTPNVVEFARLAKSQNLAPTSSSEGEEDQKDACAALARALGGVTILQKGPYDTISNGTTTLLSAGPGGLKRSGGQGDTLTGCLATLLAWRKAYLENLWDHEGDLDAEELLALAAYGGSAITRECSRLAFAEKGRSLQAGDLTDWVHRAFEEVVGEKPFGEDAEGKGEGVKL
jgi:ATP-dependent NAD(P)H-hydrate dehydratase